MITIPFASRKPSEKSYFNPVPGNFSLPGSNYTAKNHYVKQPARLQFGKTQALSREEVVTKWRENLEKNRELLIAMVIEIIKREIQLFEEHGYFSFEFGNLLLTPDKFDGLADDVVKRFPEEVEKLRQINHQRITIGEMAANNYICKKLKLHNEYWPTNAFKFMDDALNTAEMKKFKEECRHRRKGKNPVAVVAGSGWDLATVIALAKNGFDVVGLEIDKDAYEASKRLHELLDLASSLGSKVKRKIKTLNQDAANYNYRNADLVYVVPILSPEDQRKIFERICQCRHAENKRVMTILANHTLLQINLHTVPEEDLHRLFDKILKLPTTNAANKPAVMRPRALCLTG